MLCEADSYSDLQGECSDQEGGENPARKVSTNKCVGAGFVANSSKLAAVDIIKPRQGLIGRLVGFVIN